MSLYREIDQVPLGTLQALINIIMMRSFVGSVPSKMTKLRDDAQEQLFYAEDIDKIDTCLLACNGAVYIMDDIYGPADYTSVTSPAYISTTNNIIKWAIYNGSSGTDYMGLNYYAYLKAMQSEFTFFLPSDAALQYYYDPTSFKSTSKRLIQFSYRNQAFPIQSKCINYDPATGVTGRAITGQGASIQQSEITNRLKDILESHTIVHDGTNPIHGEDEYFLSKNGNAIKVARDENGTVTQVWGGFQLENLRQGISSENPGVDTCNVTKAFESLKNGQTYILDAPLIPTYRSVYSILTGDEGWVGKDSAQWYAEDPYARFYELCEVQEQYIYGCGLVDINLSQSERRSAMKKFTIFVNDNGLDYNIVGCLILRVGADGVAGRIVEHHDVVQFYITKTFHTTIVPMGPLDVRLRTDEGQRVLRERHGKRCLRDARTIADLRHEEVVARQQRFLERRGRYDVVLEEELIDEVDGDKCEHQGIYPRHDKANGAFGILPPLPTNLLGDVGIEDERHDDESQP